VFITDVYHIDKSLKKRLQIIDVELYGSITNECLSLTLST